MSQLGQRPPEIDRTVFNGLKATLPWAVLFKIVNGYSNEFPVTLRTMKQLLGDQDAPSLRRQAHTLKSTSALLGAVRLSKLCEEMEADARVGDLSMVGEQLADIEICGGRVLEELGDICLKL